MVQTAVDKLVEELSTRPYTLLVILLLMASAIYSHTKHAMAEDVDQIESKLDKLLVINISTAIAQQRVEFCRTSDSELRTLLARSINALREDYREITGNVYSLESCDMAARRTDLGDS